MAAVIFIHDGGSIEYIPPADVAAGEVVLQGMLVGVAKTAITAGKLGALAVQGVFDFPVVDLGDWEIGDVGYWDNTAGVATKTATGNALLGKVVKVNSRPGTSYVRIRVNQ